MKIYMQFKDGSGDIFTYDVFDIAMRDPDVVLIVDMQTGEIKKGTNE